MDFQGACWQVIFTTAYKAMLHIHAIVEECQIMGLLHQIDPKIKKFIKKKILFVKSGVIVVVCIQVCICHDQQWRWLTSAFLWTSPPTKLAGLQKLGHFTLCDEAIFPNSCSFKGNHHYKSCLIWLKFIKIKLKFQ